MLAENVHVPHPGLRAAEAHVCLHNVEDCHKKEEVVGCLDRPMGKQLLLSCRTLLCGDHCGSRRGQIDNVVLNSNANG